MRGRERVRCMNKVKRVNVCVLCAEIECKEHPELWRIEYQCQLCLLTHSLNREAESCCMDLVSKSVLDESHFSKEKKGKKAEAEIPVASLQGRRDK